jgi:transcriptional regulator with XRE-family HTH domain
MNNLSINLRELLCHAKISENELARRTGISQQIINRMLSGENKNPKLATLTPIAHYFTISISQLIGEELTAVDTTLNTQHMGWKEIPFIDLKQLATLPLTELWVLKHNSIMIDINPTKHTFATRMMDDSMEPKFSTGTLLIFDWERAPITGDFVLIKTPSHDMLVRQYFTKNDRQHVKCLNTKHSDHDLKSIDEASNFLGVLIQSRTDFIVR